MSANDKHLKSETQFEGIFVKEFCSAHQEIERKGSATHERTYRVSTWRVSNVLLHFTKNGNGSNWEGTLELPSWGPAWLDANKLIEENLDVPLSSIIECNFSS